MEQLLAQRVNIPQRNVTAVLELINDGATIPFIARYRKEATNSLDEVAIERIATEHNKLLEIEKRKKTILLRLGELNISEQRLIDSIKKCYDSQELEDLYLPYKPKRKTKASTAKENGFEPLAKIIMAQRQNDIDQQAKRFTKGKFSSTEVLEGARHIIAEWINESQQARNQIRRLFQSTAMISSKLVKGKTEEAIKYKDYFDFNQLLKRVPSHRILAILRAEKAGYLNVKIAIDQERALQQLSRIFVKSKGKCRDQIELSIQDAYKRLLSPSIETEMRKAAKEKADDDAILIFGNNLNQLLLAPPLGPKRILALDPGFRSGCKVVCLDEQSDFLHSTTIFPHPPQSKLKESAIIIQQFITRYKIKAIAIGNGTAGRETEQFIKNAIDCKDEIEVYLVNEDGASIYSASEIGREEFPDLDLTVRGAISIGRRLIDPLAELVKIDPKSIGVGQYQHDVDQDKLKSSLDRIVSSCVNKVGVNLNTASQHLLQYVAGIGPKVAQNIVTWRSSNGGYKSKSELLKVKGLGAKAYEQSAGFLRIKDGSNPLDSSGVHPERYATVKSMAKSIGSETKKLIGNKQLLDQIDLKEFITDEIGLPTLKDIIAELNKPGLDPRGAAQSMSFDDKIQSIDDLRINMTLVGKITNLTQFGAFVDIGIKENGLIHKSQIADRFITDPAEVLRLDQIVQVKVLDIDLKRKRIQLSMRGIDSH